MSWTKIAKKGYVTFVIVSAYVTIGKAINMAYKDIKHRRQQKKVYNDVELKSLPNEHLGTCSFIFEEDKDEEFGREN